MKHTSDVISLRRKDITEKIVEKELLMRKLKVHRMMKIKMVQLQQHENYGCSEQNPCSVQKHERSCLSLCWIQEPEIILVAILS